MRTWGLTHRVSEILVERKSSSFIESIYVTTKAQLNRVSEILVERKILSFIESIYVSTKARLKF